RYQELFDFAAEHSLTLHGFSYEMGINENVIDQIDDYIVQIEIPVLCGKLCSGQIPERDHGSDDP
ncbi:MAG: hypothetical protein K2P27_09850, partial [Lachnospiraceae bacterium]|nr:hypothetical protein [Lachnospiraceae bacterium]